MPLSAHGTICLDSARRFEASHLDTQTGRISFNNAELVKAVKYLEDCNSLFGEVDPRPRTALRSNNIRRMSLEAPSIPAEAVADCLTLVGMLYGGLCADHRHTVSTYAFYKPADTR